MAWLRLPLIAIALAALVGCGGAAVTPNVQLDPPADREALEDITVPGLSGDQPLEVRSDGRPLIINFWASWCGPCRAELPDLNDIAQERDVKVVGLLHDDVPANGRSFAEELGLSFDLGVDGDSDVYNSFNATGLPVTIFVDSDGRVASRWFGVLDRATLDEFVDQL